jgi:hypothetical protein
MKLKLIAVNDWLIEQFINDPNYTIDRSGVIYNQKGKILGFVKEGEAKARGKKYIYIKYKGKELKAHRIVYRKFNGNLDRELVVHHRDANGLNNNCDNLELTTQEINVIETQRGA